MLRNESKYEINDTLLLSQFNDRDRDTFGIVYLKYSKEFLHFSSKLFQNITYTEEDALQDIFISIWNNKKCIFNTFESLKIYVYIALKNKYKEIYNHNKYVNKYCDIFQKEASFSTQIAESEVLSYLSEAVSLLSEECAKVFLLHVDGWDVKEIAQKLNKTESTVYKQKREAISLIKKRLSEDKLLVLFLF